MLISQPLFNQFYNLFFEIHLTGESGSINGIRKGV